MELISGQQNGTLRIWDLNKSECSKELIPDGEVAFRSVHFAPNGSTAVAANNKGTCFLWKMDADGTSNIEPIQRLQAHNSYLLKSVFSPNSKFSFLFLLIFQWDFLPLPQIKDIWRPLPLTKQSKFGRLTRHINLQS